MTSAPVDSSVSGAAPVSAPAPALDSQTTAKEEPKPHIDGPMFNEFTQDSIDDSHDVPAPSIGMEQFSTFTNPLGDIDLTFQDVASNPNHESAGDWGELTGLIGTESEEDKKMDESEDVSVAPALHDAFNSTETQAPTDEAMPVDAAGVQEVAKEAEGALAVPIQPEETAPEAVVTEAAMSAEASGVPTEEVGEMPQTDLPPAVKDVKVENVGPVTVENTGDFDASVTATLQDESAVKESQNDVFDQTAHTTLPPVLGSDEDFSTAQDSQFFPSASTDTQDAPETTHGLSATRALRK